MDEKKPGEIVIERPEDMTRDEALERVKEAVKAGKIMWQCCFCHEGVPSSEVAALILIKRWGHEEGEQSTQQWFCHVKCFEQVAE